MTRENHDSDEPSFDVDKLTEDILSAADRDNEYAELYEEMSQRELIQESAIDAALLIQGVTIGSEEMYDQLVKKFLDKVGKDDLEQAIVLHGDETVANLSVIFASSTVETMRELRRRMATAINVIDISKAFDTDTETIDSKWVRIKAREFARLFLIDEHDFDLQPWIAAFESLVGGTQIVLHPSLVMDAMEEVRRENLERSGVIFEDAVRREILGVIKDMGYADNEIVYTLSSKLIKNIDPEPEASSLGITPEDLNLLMQLVKKHKP